jgi:hypothetical protein|tara:strand:+ start:360 stop:479 length:120 start_codon:yes stop_codon:yes gene_type:complete
MLFLRNYTRQYCIIDEGLGYELEVPINEVVARDIQRAET